MAIEREPEVFLYVSANLVLPRRTSAQLITLVLKFIQ